VIFTERVNVKKKEDREHYDEGGKRNIHFLLHETVDEE
jgi:hypothetical protein